MLDEAESHLLFVKLPDFDLVDVALYSHLLLEGKVHLLAHCFGCQTDPELLAFSLKHKAIDYQLLLDIVEHECRLLVPSPASSDDLGAVRVDIY